MSVDETSLARKTFSYFENFKPVRPIRPFIDGKNFGPKEQLTNELVSKSRYENETENSTWRL